MATKTTAPKAVKTPKKEAKVASSDFAIIETGGKQYLVSEGTTLKIEKVKGSLGKDGYAAYNVGDTLTFDKVLVVDNGSDTKLGAPFVAGAKVSAEITKVSRAQKVTVIKYKAKSNHFSKKGHRQPFFEVKISKLA